MFPVCPDRKHRRTSVRHSGVPGALHDAFPRRPSRSARGRSRDLHCGLVVRPLPVHARAPRRGSRARRGRGGASAPRPARLLRPPTRPLGDDGAASDAGACDHSGRCLPARRPRGARAAGGGDPAPRQLRRRVGLRPPKLRLDERAPGTDQSGQHPHRCRAGPAARGRRLLPLPEPLAVPLRAHRARGDGSVDARREGSGRTASTDAQPGRRVARPVVPERALRDRSRLLRCGGAGDRASATRPRTTPGVAIAVAIAVAVAASRVLLDLHWFSDVIGGLAIGWAWFALSAVVFGGRLLIPTAAAKVARSEAANGTQSRAAAQR